MLNSRLMQMLIPPDALVLLIGPSGSGKSTFARRHFRATQIVSSDTCRAWICDDEADQSTTKDAFELLGTVLRMRLSRGRLTIVDATSVQAWARASLLTIAREWQRPAVAIVFDLPRGVIAAQNQSRDRNVDEAVMEQQVLDLKTSLQELPGEGLAGIYVITTQAEINAAEIHLEN